MFAAPAGHAAALLETQDMSQLGVPATVAAAPQSLATAATPSLQTQPAAVAAALAAPTLPPPTPKSTRRAPQLDLRSVYVCIIL